MIVGKFDRQAQVNIILFKNLSDLRGRELSVCVVRYALYRISYVLPHFGWENIPEIIFKQIADSAFSGLRIYPYYICLILSADISRINGEIRDRPKLASFFSAVFHSLRYCVLMRTRKRCEHQFSGIRRTVINFHSGYSFVELGYLRHIAEIKLRIDSLRVHIERQCDYVNITGSFPVSEQRSLYSVGSGKKSHFGIRHGAASVVVRMK